MELDTPILHLSYDEKPFSPEGLSLSVKGGLSAYMSDWRYGQPLSTLGGTARTLDQADGEIPVGDGLISRNGFSVLDDSRSMILREDGALRPRDYAEEDLYFFGYGHDYAACLRDFYRLSGAAPLLPRWALGNWWSRFFRYTEHSYLALMEQFAAKNVPLSVAVIDMDWHLTDVPYGSGWTGYTWNRELFPDPPRFLRALHDRGMHVTLNLHPAGGVQPHEAGPTKASAGRWAGTLLKSSAWILTRRMKRSCGPIWSACIIRWKKKAWISGGSTGSRETPARFPDWIPSGCSMSFIIGITAGTANGD